MNSRKLFFVLWRVNAVVILVAGLLGCAALAVILFVLYQEASRERHVANVINMTDGRVKDSKTSLGEFRAIAGSTVLRAELQIEQEYGVSSGSKESSSTQNYLYFDPASASSYWLIPGFNGMIRSTMELPESGCEADQAPVKAIVYELIERDSNRDSQLTAADVQDVAVSDPSGTRLIRVLKDVERLNSVHLLPGDTEAVILYISAGLARAARFEISTGRILSDSELKPLKDSQLQAAARQAEQASGR